MDLRHQINSSFRQQWDKGIHAYIKGDWQKARDIFHETVKLPGGKTFVYMGVYVYMVIYVWMDTYVYTAKYAYKFI